MQPKYVRRLTPGQVIFRRGEIGQEMYLILEGSVRLAANVQAPPGPEDIVMRAGEFFGEISLLARKPRTLGAAALEATALLTITRENFLDLVATRPTTALRILEAMIKRLETAKPEEAPAPSATAPGGAGGPGAGARAGQAAPAPPARARPGADSQDVILLKGGGTSPLLFHKEMTCPACEARFLAEAVRDSRLRLTGRGPDLRMRFEGIEPLWYRVLVCPVCLAANARDQWNKMSDAAIDVLRKDRDNRRGLFGHLDFARTRDVELALASYDVGLHCNEQLGSPSMERAALALGRMWILEDLGRREEADAAAAEALSQYRDAYMRKSGTDERRDQRLGYLVAWLAYRLGEKDNILRYLEAVIRSRGGDQGIIDLARDLVQQVRAASS